MARLHDIKRDDYENTYWGLASSIWFNHCPHRCIGCWNAETWDLDESLEVDNAKVVEELLNGFDMHGVHRDLTVLGGEPFSPFNVEDLYYILTKVKEARPETKVLAWSGYEYRVLSKTKKLKKALPLIDVLVCGRFIQELKCEDTTKMYGSENQYIVDVQKSLAKGKTVYIEKGEAFGYIERLRREYDGK